MDERERERERDLKNVKNKLEVIVNNREAESCDKRDCVNQS